MTSFSQGAGTSTLAAGLAAALSETDEGKVLLVDVNLGPDHVHPFFKGKPAYPLTTALQPPSSDWMPPRKIFTWPRWEVPRLDWPNWA